MIRRHGNAIGFRLFRRKFTQLELWIAWGDIEPHIHQHIDSTIIFLFGSMVGRIQERVGILTWRDIFRRFHVPAGVVHEAKTGFVVFANLERWTSDVTSAAEDFTAI